MVFGTKERPEVPEMTTETRDKAMARSMEISEISIVLAVAITADRGLNVQPLQDEVVLVFNRATLMHDFWRWIKSDLALCYGRNMAFLYVDFEKDGEAAVENWIYSSLEKNTNWAEVYIFFFDYLDFRKWSKSWKDKIEIGSEELQESLDNMCPLRVNWWVQHERQKHVAWTEKRLYFVPGKRYVYAYRSPHYNAREHALYGWSHALIGQTDSTCSRDCLV
jgi:hypothetical protein